MVKQIACQRRKCRKINSLNGKGEAGDRAIFTAEAG
jgi:hypothetical protein